MRRIQSSTCRPTQTTSSLRGTISLIAVTIPEPIALHPPSRTKCKMTSTTLMTTQMNKIQSTCKTTVVVAKPKTTWSLSKDTGTVATNRCSILAATKATTTVVEVTEWVAQGPTMPTLLGTTTGEATSQMMATEMADTDS